MNLVHKLLFISPLVILLSPLMTFDISYTFPLSWFFCCSSEICNFPTNRIFFVPLHLDSTLSLYQLYRKITHCFLIIYVTYSYGFCFLMKDCYCLKLDSFAKNFTFSHFIFMLYSFISPSSPAIYKLLFWLAEVGSNKKKTNYVYFLLLV